MTALARILRRLGTPSNFPDDWYGWACNQISHVGLGMFGVWIMCLIAFVILGEFPYRLTVFMLFAAAYLFFELRAQRWAGWDTIEDVLFVCVYGAGGTLMAFREFEVSNSDVILNLFAPIPFLVASLLHLAAGIAYRMKKSRHD